MVDDWEQFKLGDIAKWSSGGTPPKSEEEFWGGDIPWISASSMDGNRYRDSKLKVTELGLNSGTRLATKNSILLLVRGSILHQKIQVGIAERDVTFNQDVKALKVKEEVLNPWYLLFWFMSKEPELLALVENTGIGAGKLDTKILQDLTIDVPPLKERTRILQFAKALDDKIELNRKMNETLEAMAQALFKSWFVDFDPVIDNALAAGNPIPEALKARAEARMALGDQRKPLPEEIRQQFPSRFTFSEEMGWIPEGWEVGPISMLADLNPEGWTAKTYPEIVQYVDLANAKKGRINEVVTYPFLDAPSRARRVLRKNDSIIGTVRPGNRSFAFIYEDGLTGSTGFAVMRPKAEFHRSYIYLALTREKVIELFSHLADGAAYPAIRSDVVANQMVLLPGEHLLMTFDEIAHSWLSGIGENESMSDVLANTRDTLLPKLLSGQLRIPDAEKLLQEAV